MKVNEIVNEGPISAIAKATQHVASAVGTAKTKVKNAAFDYRKYTKGYIRALNQKLKPIIKQQKTAGTYNKEQFGQVLEKFIPEYLQKLSNVKSDDPLIKPDVERIVQALQKDPLHIRMNPELKSAVKSYVKNSYKAFNTAGKNSSAADSAIADVEKINEPNPNEKYEMEFFFPKDDVAFVNRHGDWFVYERSQGKDFQFIRQLPAELETKLDMYIKKKNINLKQGTIAPASKDPKSKMVRIVAHKQK